MESSNRGQGSGGESAGALAAIRATWAANVERYDSDRRLGLLTPEVARIWAGVLREVLGERPLAVLDAGAGSGFLSVQAALRGHRVTAVDLTSAMIAAGRDRAAAAGVPVAWVAGDVARLPFSDSCFDAVISRHLLWTLPDPAAAFREWVRVVRPGGRVAWFESTWPQDRPVDRARRTLAAAVYRLTPRRLRPSGSRRRPGVYDRYAPGLAGALPLRRLSTVAPVRELLASIGVEDAHFRGIRRLRRAELGPAPLHRRLQPAGRRYAGWFDVTPALKERARRSATPPPSP